MSRLHSKSRRITDLIGLAGLAAVVLSQQAFRRTEPAVAADRASE